MAEKADSLGMVKCPTCNVSMKSSKLDQHMNRVHPKGAKTQRERMAIEQRRAQTFGALKYASIVIVVVITVLALVLLTPILPQGNPTEGPDVGDIAPDFALKDTDGQTHELQFLLGEKPIFIEIFSTDCSHCSAFATTLGQIHDDYGDRIQMYSVATHWSANTVATVASFKDSHGSSWPYLMGDEKLSEDYGIYATPSSFLISPTGEVLWTVDGRVDYTTVASAIENALNG